MKITINIDNRLHARLKKESEVSSQPMTAIINQAIARYLESVHLQGHIKKTLLANPEALMEILSEVVKKVPNANQ